MKTYIKPTTKEILVKMQPLMDVVSGAKQVSGLDGVTMGDHAFEGGDADSRRGSLWDDED